MKKNNLFFTIILALSLVGSILWGIPLGVFAPKSPPHSLPPSTIVNYQTFFNQSNKNMSNKILMVVAFKDFKDEEYFVTKEVLERAGYLIETTSSQKGIARGSEGGDAIITLLPPEVHVDDYQAIVFIGGSGMIKELNNKDFQNLAMQFNNSHKVVAAICAAPALLAQANLLKGKKATVWSSPLDKSLVKILENHGALYENQEVVRDQNLITAKGPEFAKAFGEKIVEILKIK